ncbi:hypothetical protein [Thermoanaerobacter pentosaceus]|uniref:BioD-like phosphotransacetylase family protein n=1 Tax=Thermoanaerobacter pentosaceus TaxID=694059 RepID=A0ABT9M5L2_9THEO|nr:hypothetical protein [Thermoanaerobacter pentosaceus]MDP9751386.1 BioD-like phosphotransacetylase family protein [Thermoanaerobacter pentosaceus]
MGILKFLSSRKFYWGIGAAALGLMLFPKAQKNMKPSLEKSVKELQEVVNKLAEFFDNRRQMLIEIVKNKMEELREQESQKEEIIKQKQQALQQLEYLKNKIQTLEEQIKTLE